MVNNTHEEIPIELIPKGGFGIEFPGVSATQAGQYAEGLETELKNSVQDHDAIANVERIRTNPEAQDLGTTLGIILGAKATVALAYGIGKWLTRNNQAKVRIRTRNGDVYEFDNLNSDKVEKTIGELNLGS